MMTCWLRLLTWAVVCVHHAEMAWLLLWLSGCCCREQLLSLIHMAVRLQWRWVSQHDDELDHDVYARDHHVLFPCQASQVHLVPLIGVWSGMLFYHSDQRLPYCGNMQFARVNAKNAMTATYREGTLDQREVCVVLGVCRSSMCSAFMWNDSLSGVWSGSASWRVSAHDVMGIAHLLLLRIMFIIVFVVWKDAIR